MTLRVEEGNQRCPNERKQINDDKRDFRLTHTGLDYQIMTVQQSSKGSVGKEVRQR